MTAQRFWETLGLAASVAALLSASCGGDDGTISPSSATGGDGGAGSSGGSKAIGGTDGGLSEDGGEPDAPGGRASTGGNGGGGASSAGAPGGRASTGGNGSGGAPSGGASTGGNGSGDGGAPSSGGASTAGGATGGAGKGGAAATSTTLGASCASDGECGQGHLCLLPEVEGFQNGYCTVNASCATDADCEALSPASKCLTVGGGAAICLEGCEYGEMSGEKCHGRDDTVCTPLPRASGPGSCMDDAGCGPDGACDAQGRCREPEAACFPACRIGIDDCPSGRFCDPRSGLCGDTPPVGLSLGEACDPELECPAGTPNEDCCQGVCQAITDEDGTVLTATCTHACAAGGSVCAYDGVTFTITGRCLYALLDGAAIGDAGLCVPLCDCDEQCSAPEHGCVDAGLFDLFGAEREGLCVYPADGSGEPFPTIEICE